jgi:hypothetical protein
MLQKQETRILGIPSIQDIQNAVSADNDLIILKAFDNSISDVSVIKANFNRKQFYSRLSKFTKAHLIEGKRGQVSPYLTRCVSP